MLSYPLHISFKIMAFSPQITIIDGNGNTVFYIKQKAMALKENISVFTNEGMQTLTHTIKAEKFIDFTNTFTIRRSNGQLLGYIKRKGFKSLWNAHYQVHDAKDREAGLIHEENPWIKLLDSFLSVIPLVSLWINPVYLIAYNGIQVLKMKKMPAFFEGKFILEKTGECDEITEELLVMSVILMVLLERTRG